MGKYSKAMMALFFLQGMIESDFIIMSAAESLSTETHNEDNIALLPIINYGVSCITIIIVFVFFTNKYHLPRIIASGLLVCASYVCIAISSNAKSFEFIMLSIILLGIGVSLGEVTIVGYCDLIAPCFEQMFTSGTRGSGLFSSALYLVLRSAGLSNTIIFIVLLPLPVGYVIIFSILYKNHDLLVRKVTKSVLKKSEKGVMESIMVEEEYKEDANLKTQTLCQAAKLCLPIFIIGILLAFFDSWGMSGYPDRIKDERELYKIDKTYFERYFYEISQVIIQLSGCIAAVMLGKKMANHIPKLLIFQILNFSFTMYLVMKAFSMNIIILLAAPVFFGFAGGLSFVGTLTSISKSKKLSTKNKESCSSVMLLLYDAGMCLGLCFVFIFDHYIRPIDT